MCGIRVTESLLQAPCGDKLCRKCVETGARRYLVSDPKDNRVPASCCGTVLPLDLVLRVISDTELTTYAKRLVKYVDATKDLTTPSTRGTKRKAASEKKSTVSARAPKGSKGKAPAKRAKKAANQKQEQERVCVACYSNATPPGSLMIVPCGHAYCLSCLAIMAKTSLTDRSQVPIRCCSKEFPVEYADQVLTKLEFEQYKSYLAECTPKKSSLLSDRVYTAVKARAVLSARAAPLRCCKKVVPHDFVRDVLDHEEDVYYSFLLKLTSSEMPLRSPMEKCLPSRWNVRELCKMRLPQLIVFEFE
ncbi:hypothetical protein PInf_015417 [Phytophthora infestans]|nr:hypothetical protein PInf_015417 [Phytophthora infestans]